MTRDSKVARNILSRFSTCEKKIGMVTTIMLSVFKQGKPYTSYSHFKQAHTSRDGFLDT